MNLVNSHFAGFATATYRSTSAHVKRWPRHAGTTGLRSRCVCSATWMCRSGAPCHASPRMRATPAHPLPLPAATATRTGAVSVTRPSSSRCKRARQRPGAVVSRVTRDCSAVAEAPSTTIDSSCAAVSPMGLSGWPTARWSSPTGWCVGPTEAAWRASQGARWSGRSIRTCDRGQVGRRTQRDLRARAAAPRRGPTHAASRRHPRRSPRRGVRWGA